MATEAVERPRRLEGSTPPKALGDADALARHRRGGNARCGARRLREVRSGNAAWRREVVTKAANSADAAREARLSPRLVQRDGNAAARGRSVARAPSAVPPDWGQLVKRVFGEDGRVWWSATPAFVRRAHGPARRGGRRRLPTRILTDLLRVRVHPLPRPMARAGRVTREGGEARREEVRWECGERRAPATGRPKNAAKAACGRGPERVASPSVPRSTAFIPSILLYGCAAGPDFRPAHAPPQGSSRRPAARLSCAALTLSSGSPK